MRALFARHRFDRVFHLAAVLSSKAERDPDLAAARQRRRDATGSSACASSRRRARARRRASSSRAASPCTACPTRTTKLRAGCDPGDRTGPYPPACTAATSCTARSLGAATCRDARGAAGARLPLDPLPGSDQRRDAADRRDDRLRAGDDPRRGARRGLYAASSREDSRLPFMTMPDAIDALLALADAERRAAAHAGLQHPGVQRVCGRDARGDAAALSRVRRSDSHRSRRASRSSTPGRARSTTNGPARTGGSRPGTAWPRPSLRTWFRRCAGAIAPRSQPPVFHSLSAAGCPSATPARRATWKERRPPREDDFHRIRRAG